eukprot:CAMPEP_0197038102 /NCGR_PEP_ID=MMETSP1384-20130603/15122_1 /TAXON_ID=29189 /ORGANISM="Ammonia sp." /LENGTH=374 /DNA_ID=CAMNT_0042468495 /DNA_START=143 /DNA_END=1267 /DNA_ORIENTATION=+
MIQNYLESLDHYIESTSNTGPNLHFYYTAAAEKIDQYQMELNQFKRLLLLNSSSPQTELPTDELDYDLDMDMTSSSSSLSEHPHSNEQHEHQKLGLMASPSKASCFLFDDEPYLPVIEEDKETVYSLDEHQPHSSHSCGSATPFTSEQPLQCDSSDDDDDDEDDDDDDQVAHADDDGADSGYFGGEHTLDHNGNAYHAIQNVWSSSPAYYASLKNSYAQHNQFALRDTASSSETVMDRGHQCLPAVASTSACSLSSLHLIYIEEQAIGASFKGGVEAQVASSRSAIFGTDEQKLVYVLVSIGGIERAHIQHIEFKQNYQGCYYALVHIRCASLALINCMINRIKAKFANNIDIFKMQSLQLLESEDEQVLINRS